MSMLEGRWTGQWFEWSCPGCGCMRTSLSAPLSEQASCLRCKANAAAKSIQDMVDALQNERDEWMARARSAERRNGAYEDEIYDLKQKLCLRRGSAA